MMSQQTDDSSWGEPNCVMLIQKILHRDEHLHAVCERTRRHRVHGVIATQSQLVKIVIKLRANKTSLDADGQAGALEYRAWNVRSWRGTCGIHKPSSVLFAGKCSTV